MAIAIRVPRPEEFDDFFTTVETSFFEQTRSEALERFRYIFELERCIGAFDGETRIGTAGAFSFSLSVPGGEVPAAGVTIVGVLPTHRRRGVLTAMMRHQLDDVRGRGEPLAILWASEGTIYPRFGYGLASLQGTIDIARDRSAFREPSEPVGRTRLLTMDEALKVVPPVYERIRARIPGMFARSSEWWRWKTMADPEHKRDGAGPKFWAVWEDERGPAAYAGYRFKHRWEPHGYSQGVTEVIEAIGASPTATREIWRFIFGIDLAERIEAWWLPLDHPLLWLVGEPRRLNFTIKDALWLRIVDMVSALEGRRYLAAGRVTFEVADRFCPWNEGRWRLEVADGRARVERTSADADIACDIQDLGATYLGGASWRQLGGAGRVSELSPGSVERADAMFRSHRAPWCPEIF